MLVVNAKFNKQATAKTSETLKSEITTAISNYNLNTLTAFDGVFRYSKVTGLIDSVDNSILSNITTVKIRKEFTPTLASSTKYDIYFRNPIYNPHSGHESVLSSTGFKISGNNNEMFLDDDGIGNNADTDDDNDGLSDWFEINDGNDLTGQFDHDNDAIDDHLDDDDDGDGILDSLES